MFSGSTLDSNQNQNCLSIRQMLGILSRPPKPTSCTRDFASTGREDSISCTNLAPQWEMNRFGLEVATSVASDELERDRVFGVDDEAL